MLIEKGKKPQRQVSSCMQRKIEGMVTVSHSGWRNVEGTGKTGR
jgi:hypothetical protein